MKGINWRKWSNTIGLSNKSGILKGLNYPTTVQSGVLTPETVNSISNYSLCVSVFNTLDK